MQINSISLALLGSLITTSSALAHTTPEMSQAVDGSHHNVVAHAAKLLDAQPSSAADMIKLAASSGDSGDHSSMKRPGFTVGDLVITDVRAGATVPKAPVAGGYMLITNNGSAADVLVGGQAAFAGDVQIHEMKMQGDVMKMRQLADGLEIPAGGEVMLKPGGYHVMFMKLTEPLTEGESRKATLTFKNAGSVEVEFSIKSRRHLNAHGMDHSGHGSSN